MRGIRLGPMRFEQFFIASGLDRAITRSLDQRRLGRDTDAASTSGPVKRRIMIYLKVGVGIYLLLVLFLIIFQRKLIYLPTRLNEAGALYRGAAFKLEPVRDGNGTIFAWRSPARTEPAANRMIVFHGNAGSATDRDYYRDGFESLDDGRLWEVLLFEYPGYGARPGSPGQPEITRAALAAISELTANDSRPVYLLGESIGSGPACAVAETVPDKISGLFLMTPFARLADVAAKHFPFFPVRLILRDRWDNVRALRNYHGPVAIRIAGEDEIVTPQQGEKLFAACAEPKRRWIDPHGTHNLTDIGRDAPWWQEVSDFLRQKK